MFLIILLQAAGENGSTNFTWLFFAAIILIFYFFMIRPQQKKQKAQKKFMDSIIKGAMVVTVGGIHGKILSIENNIITLEVDRGVKIKVDKSSISLESSKRYSKDSTEVKKQ